MSSRKLGGTTSTARPLADSRAFFYYFKIRNWGGFKMKVKDTLNLGKTKFPMRDIFQNGKVNVNNYGKKIKFTNNDKN